ncbi:MAG: TIGR00296 family protein [Candidatus Diapherotrites archaeon]
MSKKFSLEDAQKLVKVARKSIEYTLATGQKYKDDIPRKFLDKRGVFVTLEKFPSGELRGCIGFPEPVMPLWLGVIEAASSAAFSDTRFQQIDTHELDEITIEISVLTVPEEITVSKGRIAKHIEIGKDGLIIRKGYQSGLLLPQVGFEYNWTPEEFLQHTCQKAGLKSEAWKDDDTQIFKFQAQIFHEVKPNGEIEEE